MRRVIHVPSKGYIRGFGLRKWFSCLFLEYEHNNLLFCEDGNAFGNLWFQGQRPSQLFEQFHIGISIVLTAVEDL